MKNKRYWVFVGIDYYPKGGTGDLSGTFNELPCEEALKGACIKREEGWIEVFDTQEMKVAMIISYKHDWRENKVTKWKVHDPSARGGLYEL